jgi:hypothetical protein
MTILQEVITQTKTQTWLAFLTPLMIAISGVVTIYFQNFFTKQSEAKAAVQATKVATAVAEVKTATEVAAKKVEQVAQTRAVDVAEAKEQTNKILVLSDKTHTLVNSQHGIALATVYEQALRIAALTNDPADIQKADEAKKKLADHQAKQSVVDANEDQGNPQIK